MPTSVAVIVLPRECREIDVAAEIRLEGEEPAAVILGFCRQRQIEPVRRLEKDDRAVRVAPEASLERQQRLGAVELGLGMLQDGIA